MPSKSERQPREPVRTTIVGGQPEVRTKSSLPIPEGIERAITRAAGDQRFRRQLLADRMEAVRSVGIELTAGEQMILSSVSEAQLGQLIAQAPLPTPPRRHFLQAAFCWLAALLGGAAVTATTGCPRDRHPPVEGIRPDTPPPKDDEPEDESPPVTRGIQPDVPAPSDDE